MYTTFGHFVKRVREERGLSAEELAQRLSVSCETVNAWESGQIMPDEDGLCALADALEVNVPELEQGRYLYEDNQEADRVAEPLILPSFSGLTKLRRILACAMDFMITMVVGILLLGAAVACNAEYVGLVLWFVVSVFGFFLRDFTWNGRSLGKRVMGLAVLNKRTGEPPARWNLAVRTLFWWTGWIDLLVMLATGRSIGDYVMHTVVIPKKEVPSWKAALTMPSEATKSADARQTKTWLRRVGIGFLVFVLIALSGALIGLQIAKTTPEYELAYTYFIESDTFAQLGVSENRVWMNTYSLQTINGQKHLQISFTVGLRQYHVICHTDDAGEWMVCEECTSF